MIQFNNPGTWGSRFDPVNLDFMVWFLAGAAVLVVATLVVARMVRRQADRDTALALSVVEGREAPGDGMATEAWYRLLDVANHPEQGKSKASLIHAGGLTIAFLLILAPLMVIGGVERATANDARAAYAEEVRNWLAADYSIDVTAAEAQSLSYGHDLAVVLDGETVAIELVPGQDDDMWVRVSGRRILQTDK